MAVYAIGDVQGCLDELRQLLDRLHFDPAFDTLWFTGDLVNRGPASAATLRFVRELKDSAITVLGNHDLHLLAIAAGYGHPKRQDTLDDVLSAPDCDELLGWLASRPLLHHDTHLGTTLVHAGIHPHWSLAQAQAYARELEAVLQGPEVSDYFAAMYGNHPERWHDDLIGIDRLRVITNVFTRMRYVDKTGGLNLDQKLGPNQTDSALMPWFEVPDRVMRGQKIIFGHWSTLGLFQNSDYICIDSGCLWGGRLTALRLDMPPDKRISAVTSVACVRRHEPKSRD